VLCECDVWEVCVTLQYTQECGDGVLRESGERGFGVRSGSGVCGVCGGCWCVCEVGGPG